MRALYYYIILNYVESLTVMSFEYTVRLTRPALHVSK